MARRAPLPAGAQSLVARLTVAKKKLPANGVVKLGAPELRVSSFERDLHDQPQLAFAKQRLYGSHGLGRADDDDPVAELKRMLARRPAATNSSPRRNSYR